MLVEVQLLRAVAALMVLALHLSQHLALHLGFGSPVLHGGAAGVDLFFVISGFIMVWSCRHDFGRPGVRPKFVRRRLIRIVPLYWLMTAVFLAALLTLRAIRPEAVRFNFDPHRIIAPFLFVPWPDAAGAHNPAFSPGWTLNHEMFFYAVFALLLGLSLGRAVLALTLLFAAVVAIGQASDAWPFAVQVWSAPLILEFVAGAWIALARIRGLTLVPALRVTLIASGVTALAAQGIAASWMSGPAAQWLTEPDVATRTILWGVPAALVIAGLTLGSGWTRRGIGTRAMVLLGDASYSIYLVHAFVIFGIRPVAVALRDMIALSPVAYAAGLLLAALGASLAVHLLVERPLHRMLLARFTRPERGVPATALAGSGAPATSGR